MHRSAEKIDVEHFVIQGSPVSRTGALCHMDQAQRRASCRAAGELTIVHVSDLHSRHRRHLLETVIGLQPDGVMITGDLFDGVQSPKPAFEFVAGLRNADLDVFYVTGNHELYRQDVAQLLDQLRALGVTVLENEEVAWKGIHVAGVEFDAWPEDIRFPETEQIRLLLVHDPYKADRLSEATASLILAGHIHGGQWRLFHQGLAGPGHRLLPKYTSGLYRTVQGMSMVVSRGLGDWMKIPRICNPWHLPVIHLLLPEAGPMAEPDALKSGHEPVKETY